MTSVQPSNAPAPRATRWVRPAVWLIALAAAAMYLWSLDRIGFANTYYSAAVLAATKSWKAFFFGSFDANSFITVDKPPASLWVMALSARVFGVNAWSLLIPEALMGVATVVMVYHVVRRWFGFAAGLLAAVIMLLTPIAVVMFRYNNPDALLTLLFILAAAALQRAIDGGGTRWIVLAAGAVGLAFNTKYLAGYIILPALLVTHLIAAVGSLRRRIVQLVIAGVALLLSSGWWLAIVDLIPAGSRPYIAGSTNNSVLNLVLGYDGFGRITGQERPGGVGGGAVGGAAREFGGFANAFGGGSGATRMFNDQVGGQISWLIPLAIICLAAGLWLHRRTSRTGTARAGYILFGAWLLTHAVVFSTASGIFHAYYTIAMAPAIAGLVGPGVVDLWQAGRRSWVARVVLGGALAGTAVWGDIILRRSPAFYAHWGDAAVVVAAIGFVALLVARARPRVAFAALAMGLAAVLTGPVVYAADVVGRSAGGGDPSAGPAIARRLGPGRQGFPPGFPLPGGPGRGVSDRVDPALTTYLLAHRGSAAWIVATTSAMQASPIELATGQPVMAMGGFMGSDPAPTVTQLQDLIASDRLRFVLIGGPDGPGDGRGIGGDRSVRTPELPTSAGPDGAIAIDNPTPPLPGFMGGVSAQRTTWVRRHCVAVSYAGSRSGNVPSTQLYDCNPRNILSHTMSVSPTLPPSAARVPQPPTPPVRYSRIHV